MRSLHSNQTSINIHFTQPPVYSAEEEIKKIKHNRKCSLQVHFYDLIMTNFLAFCFSNEAGL